MTRPPLSLDHAKPLPPLARRYASALYDLAAERGQIEMVEKDADALDALIKESAELRRFLTNPLTPRRQIAASLEKLFESARFSGLIRHFMHVTVGNGRARDIPQILTAFRARLWAARGIVTADVVTANPLDAAQQDRLRAALADALATHGVKQVHLNARVEREVLGGISVQVGAWMYNGTLKSRLQELGRYLKQ